MAMPLVGRRLAHARGFNITSDAIAPGSIQVPGGGQPIVLMADRQTTGGYPKIATVISADLPALGRTPIGATIGFERVTVEAAQALRRSLLAEVEGIGDRIVPLRESGGLAPRLQDDNLISGVVDARNWAI
jgi:allophanate hydrolase subunit 2